MSSSRTTKPSQPPLPPIMISDNDDDNDEGDKTMEIDDDIHIHHSTLSTTIRGHDHHHHHNNKPSKDDASPSKLIDPSTGASSLVTTNASIECPLELDLYANSSNNNNNNNNNNKFRNNSTLRWNRYTKMRVSSYIPPKAGGGRWYATVGASSLVRGPVGTSTGSLQVGYLYSQLLNFSCGAQIGHDSRFHAGATVKQPNGKIVWDAMVHTVGTQQKNIHTNANENKNVTVNDIIGGIMGGSLSCRCRLWNNSWLAHARLGWSPVSVPNPASVSPPPSPTAAAPNKARRFKTSSSTTCSLSLTSTTTSSSTTTTSSSPSWRNKVRVHLGIFWSLFANSCTRMNGQLSGKISPHQTATISASHNFVGGTSSWISWLCGGGGFGGSQCTIMVTRNLSSSSTLSPSSLLNNNNTGQPHYPPMASTTTNQASFAMGFRHTMALGLSYLLEWKRGNVSIYIPIVLLNLSSKSYSRGSVSSSSSSSWYYFFYPMAVLYLSFVSGLVDAALADLFSPKRSEGSNDNETNQDDTDGEDLGGSFLSRSHQHDLKTQQDAQLQQDLMAKQAANRRMQEEEQGGLVIESATWGRRRRRRSSQRLGTDDAASSSSVWDVTVPLQFWVTNSTLSIPPLVNKGDLLGFYQPVAAAAAAAADSSKQSEEEQQPMILTVRYKYSNEMYQIVVEEKDELALPSSRARRIVA